MLKTFRVGDAVSGLRWREPGAAVGWFAGAAVFALFAAVAFALGRAVFLGGIAPFALALFAAGVVSGRHTAALLAGCVLAALRGSLADFNLCLPIGCAAILGGDLLWGAAAPAIGRLRAAMRRGPEIQARSPNRTRMARAAALAGIGALAPGLALAGGRPWESALATGAALAALGAAPFMVDVLALSPSRRCLLSEERLGLGLLCAMLAAGLFALWPPLALGFSLVAALLANACGMALGLGLGAMLLAVSGDAGCLAALGIGGAAAQLCRSGKRWRMALVSALAAVAAGAVSGLAPALLGGLAAGAPVCMLLPRRAWALAEAWLRKPGEGCDPDRLAAVLREQAAGRLRAMGAAFGELAEGYLTPAALPDGQALLGTLRSALCEGCPGFDDCWAGEHNRAARLLCDLTAMAVSWSESGPEGAGLFEEGVPSDVARRCRRSRAIPERLGGLLEDFALARRSALRRGGENRLISAQFLQAQALLEGLAAAQSRPMKLRNRQAAQAAAVLERSGIALSDALLISGRQTALVLTLKEGRWTPDLAGRAASALAAAFGRAYVPQGAGGRTLEFTRRPRLRARTGIACLSGEAGAPSGDSHLCAELDDRRVLAVICDGMGSGEAAARESASAVRLLGRFLSAGSEWPLAVETVNALMLNAGSDDMFSTMDLLLLDLSSGLAEFVKLAASPTLLLRGGAVERIEGGRLPLGILDRVQPAAVRVQLMPGDVVLLASDGVMDAVDEGALEALLAAPGDDMNALAERVLARACEGAGADRRDDMTALCLRVETAVGEAA